MDEKIEKAQNAVYQAKERYDSAVEELNSLLKKKQELQKQELWKALEASTKSYDEIMEFLIVAKQINLEAFSDELSAASSCSCSPIC